MPDPLEDEVAEYRTKALCSSASSYNSNQVDKPCANCPQMKSPQPFNRKRCSCNRTWVEEKLSAGNPITNPKSLPSSSKSKSPECSVLAIDGEEHKNELLPSLGAEKEKTNQLAEKMSSMTLANSDESPKYWRGSSSSTIGHKRVSLGNSAPDIDSSFVSSDGRCSIPDYLQNKRLKPFEDLQGSENSQIRGMIMPNSMGISVEPTDHYLFRSGRTAMDVENDCPVSSHHFYVSGFELDPLRHTIKPCQILIYNNLDPRETELATAEIEPEEAGQ